MDRADDVLQFWFPAVAPDDQQAMTRQLEWWFRGGADADIDRRFRPLHERAAALDPTARALARSGIAQGHYAALVSPWEKTFFSLPLGHSEDLSNLDEAVRLADELVHAAPPAQRALLEHSASQARGHREVVARFGRQPHRNAVLGRTSTPEELEYLAHGEFVHQRQPPRQVG